MEMPVARTYLRGAEAQEAELEMRALLSVAYRARVVIWIRYREVKRLLVLPCHSQVDGMMRGSGRDILNEQKPSVDYSELRERRKGE
jgi:hypothetical protein